MKAPTGTWAEHVLGKILSPDELVARLVKVRAAGADVATLNGSFDLLHAGHMHIIHCAATAAEILVVALNTDASVRRYKGVGRPIIPLRHRMHLMAALHCVDFVTWFDEDDPRELLSLIKPDVHVNGEEYGDACIEAETVRRNGGRLLLVNRIPGLATREVITAIQSLKGQSGK